MLSAVYYFHRRPCGFTGGALRLYSFAQTPDVFIDLAPDDNSLIAFPSWAPHEVLPVRSPSGDFADTRFAINCWVHTDRPAGTDTGRADPVSSIPPQ